MSSFHLACSLDGFFAFVRGRERRSMAVVLARSFSLLHTYIQTTTAFALKALAERLHMKLPCDFIYSGVVHLLAVLGIAIAVATSEQMSQTTALHIQKRDQSAKQENNAHCAADE